VTVHSSQLFAGKISVTTLVTLYTVPADIRTILKSLVISNQAGSASRVTVEHVIAGAIAAIIDTFPATGTANGNTILLLPWLVMNTGDVLKVTGTQQPYYIAASGTELDL
jgi:hypothetical protein